MVGARHVDAPILKPLETVLQHRPVDLLQDVEAHLHLEIGRDADGRSTIPLGRDAASISSRVNRWPLDGLPCGSGRFGQDGLKTTTARGGNVSGTEYGCPCHGLGSAPTPPAFPTLPPP